MEQIPTDTSAPEKIIRERAENAGLNPDRLILCARKYYPTKTMKKTIDIILGEPEE